MLHFSDPAQILLAFVAGTILVVSFLSSYRALYIILVANCFLLGSTSDISAGEVFYFVLLLSCISGWICRNVLRTSRNYHRRSYRILILFMLVCGISFVVAWINSISLIDGIRDFSSVANYLLLFVAFEAFDHPKKFQRFLLVFMILAVGITARDLVFELNMNRITSVDNVLGKVFVGIGGVGYTHTTLFTAMCLGFVAKKKKHRVVLVSILGMSLILVLLSMTRTYWIGVVATIMGSFGYLHFTGRLKESRSLFRLVAALSILVVSIALVLNVYLNDVEEVIGKRFGTVLSATKGETDYSMLSRINESRAAYKRTLENPLLGHGLGYKLTFWGKTFEQSYSKGMTTTPFLHNSYQYFVLKTGFVGFAIFLVFLWFLLRDSYYVYRHEEEPWVRAISLSFLLAIVYLIIISATTGKFTDLSAALYIGVFGGFIIRRGFYIRELRPA